MRISDWSSDVCSSDLSSTGGAKRDGLSFCGNGVSRRCCFGGGTSLPSPWRASGEPRSSPGRHRRRRAPPGTTRLWSPRSEEHTSELQSLLRNSYAVFCLKKKKHQLAHHTATRHIQES